MLQVFGSVIHASFKWF